MFAFKNRHQYHDLDMNLAVSANSRIIVAVHDQRAEVISNERAPDYTGLMRSGVGIPFPISTKSGNSLATDMAASISKALVKKGCQVTTAAASPTENHQQVLDRLKSLNAGKIVILHVEAWNNDCYQMVWCNYNLVLQVYDETGKFLAQKMLKGTDELGGSMWNPAKHARKAVPPAFIKKTEELFGSPEIMAAL